MGNNAVVIHAPDEYLDATISLEYNYPNIHSNVFSTYYDDRFDKYAFSKAAFIAVNAGNIASIGAEGVDPLGFLAGTAIINALYLFTAGSCQLTCVRQIEKVHRRMVCSWAQAKVNSNPDKYVDGLAKKLEIIPKSPFHLRPRGYARYSAIERLVESHILLEHSDYLSIDVFANGPRAQ